MARNNSISFSRSASREDSDVELRDTDDHLPGLQNIDLSHAEAKRKRVLALLSAAVSQIPIWGFAMNYGVFQEYYASNWTLQGNRDITGIIGTTSNGVMYLSMPIFFALFTNRLARYRRSAALLGAVLATASFLLSSYSTAVWHLVLTQGVLAALGCALLYSPTTLSLGEWYNTGNRAVAYGVTLSCKNIVGSAFPFLFRGLLDHYGFRMTLRIWTAMAAGTGILTVFLMPAHPSTMSTVSPRSRKIPWQFLKHKTFYIFSIATMLQSAGYGIPQTYLSSYAHEVTSLSQTSATLLLTLFNAPGILSSSFFGYLSDKKRFSLSATAVTSIIAVSSALATFFLWGFTSRGSAALIMIFSITFGFFSSAYSATWGGIVNELEQESMDRNEPLDSGMIYGLLNGARGIGYVAGGLSSVPLLKAGGSSTARFGYGTSYGPLIIFTGLSSVFGGWNLLWKCGSKLLR